MPMPDATGAWTLEELHRLPDDGNKYELVRGELFVTPPPSVRHESLLAVLSARLTAYVSSHGIGRVHHPRSVVRVEGSELEPDLMVRPFTDPQGERWEELPLPILVVEVLSGSTRRRDHIQKRDFYMDAGIREYWIVDGEHRTIRVIRPGKHDLVSANRVTWAPGGAAESLVIDVRAYFTEALG